MMEPDQLAAVGPEALAHQRPSLLGRLEGLPGWLVALGILLLSRAFSAAVIVVAWVFKVPPTPFEG
ncbi:MAG TPA: hypothetical protein VIR16_10505, partial [Candidatus Limnocylindrales bacterium]